MTDSNRIPLRSLYNSRFLFNITYTQNGNLRLVNDRGSKQTLECTEVSNSKRTTVNIIGQQFIVSRLQSQRINGNSQSVQTQTVGIMYYRHNQISIVQRNGNTHIDMFLEENIVSIHRYIHLRIGCQCFRYGFRNHRHIGQLHTFTTEESIFVLLTPNY